MEANARQSKRQSLCWQPKLPLQPGRRVSTMQGRSPPSPLPSTYHPGLAGAAALQENTAAERPCVGSEQAAANPAAGLWFLHHRAGSGKGKRGWRDAARSGSGARAGTVVIGGRSRRCPRWPGCIKPVVPRAGGRCIPMRMSVCATSTSEGGETGQGRSKGTSSRAPTAPRGTSQFPPVRRLPGTGGSRGRRGW